MMERSRKNGWMDITACALFSSIHSQHGSYWTLHMLMSGRQISRVTIKTRLMAFWRETWMETNGRGSVTENEAFHAEMEKNRGGRLIGEGHHGDDCGYLLWEDKKEKAKQHQKKKKKCSEVVRASNYLQLMTRTGSSIIRDGLAGRRRWRSAPVYWATVAAFWTAGLVWALMRAAFSHWGHNLDSLQSALNGIIPAPNSVNGPNILTFGLLISPPRHSRKSFGSLTHSVTKGHCGQARTELESLCLWMQ